MFVLWAERLDANQIYSEMHPVYGGKCFTTRTVHVWSKTMLNGQKFASAYLCAMSCLSVTWTVASIVLCIRHLEACWQMGQMFERTWRICWKM